MGIKITDLTALATAPNTADVIAIVDVSDTTQAPSGTTKKITIADLGFLSSGDNITELTNNAGYITSSDFSNGGELAFADRDLGNTDAFALSFITNGVGRINIEAGGNVGIGTTTPTQKLEVAGTGAVTSQLVVGQSVFGTTHYGDSAPKFQVHDGSYDHYINANNWSMETGSNATFLSMTAGGTAYFGTFAAGDLIFRTANANRVSILNSNGNVGIGTLTPTQKLEVVGNTKVTNGNIELTQNISTISLHTDNVTAGSGNGISARNNGSFQGMSYSSYNGVHWFGTDEFGSTAVGTVIDSRRGILRRFAEIESDITGLTLKVQTNDLTDRLLVQTRDAAHTTYIDRFSILGGAANPVAYFENISGLGIGTATPSEKLEVAGNLLVNGEIRSLGNVTTPKQKIFVGGNTTSTIYSSIGNNGTVGSGAATTQGLVVSVVPLSGTSEHRNITSTASSANSNTNFGVYAIASEGASSVTGVYGKAASISVGAAVYTAGLRGENTSSVGNTHNAIRAEAKATNGTSYGVYSQATGAATNNIGLYATATGATTNYAIKSDGNINMANLPTSSAGLSAGDLWNNAGVINIV